MEEKRDIVAEWALNYDRMKQGNNIRYYTGYLKKLGMKIEWDEMKKCGSCPAFEWSDKYKDGKCREKNQFLSEYYPGIEEYKPLWCPMVLKPRE
jgi:hypothetical protein